MSKKKVWITLSLVVVILLVIEVCVLNSGIIATAKYSSQYNKTFGEFTATTASKLLKDSTENTCYSPVSLFAALTLTTELSEGKTQQEILNGLGVESIDELEENYAQMLGDIDVNSQVSKIVLANSFWIAQKELDKDTQEAIDSMKEKLECEIFIDNQINPSKVNQWVSGKTNGLIDKILSDESKSMVLANTVYYKSKWAVELERMTLNQKFYLEDGEEIKTSFLSTEEQVMEYKVENDYTYVEVPLDEGEVILVLPKEGKKLNSIINQHKLNEILATATSTEDKKEGLVNLKVPEFEIEYQVDSSEFEKMLGKLGIKELFKKVEWIDGIEEVSPEIQQKTKYILNEEGVEAAATTTVLVEYSAGAENEIDLDITYDRPFLYILMKDGVPLFIGTVYNPAE